ncbi:MAG: Flp family type IVb pilin [Myxococcales bacterium]
MNTTTNTSNHSATSASRFSFVRKLSRFSKDTRGASFVEYLVLVGVVALAGIAAMQQISNGINSKAGDQAGKIQSIGG